MTSLLNIGINSLYAAKIGLSISNHNIANANNPNYSRRTIALEEVTLGLVGSGVKVGDVKRIADEFVNKSLVKARSSHAYAQKGYDSLKGLEVLLDNDAKGLTDVINKSLSDLNSLNANAASGTDRQVYLQQLSSITGRFNLLSSSLNSLNSNTNQAIKQELTKANNIVDKLADLNKVIARAGSLNASENMPLFDQRDKLLSELSEIVGFTSQTDDNGMLNIQVGNGAPLLVGTKAYQLDAKPSAKDPQILEIGFVNATQASNLNEVLTGGKISNLIDFQRETIQPTQNALGRMALGLSKAINDQNKKGMDLNGDLGGNIFKDINTASLSQNRISANNNNIGNGTLSVAIDDIGLLKTDDYRLEFSSATDYQLINISDKTVVSSGSIAAIPHQISADGFEITISAASFNSGDSFLVTPTRNGADSIALERLDGSKLALAFPVAANSSENNLGKGQISVTDITDVGTPEFSMPGQLTPPVRIEFTSASTYRLVNANDSSVIEAGLAYDPTGQAIFPTIGGYDPGYRAYLEGDVQAGDEFTLDYNSSGQGDNRNGLRIADLYKDGLFNNGELNLVEAYSALTSEISSMTNVASIQFESQEVLKNQAEERRDQISGVSIEEETLNMAQFEQSYMASAQILDSFKTMFETIIGMMRG